jgi:muconolactone delta-isomerase
MSRYVLLYRAPSSAIEQMASATPEQAQAGMDAWMRWTEAAGERIVDLGAPLGESTAVGASSDGDGGHIAGYSIMQAGSVDELKDVLESHPHLQMDGASIQVLEVLPMPGT